MHSKQRIFMYGFSLWFLFCSVEHFDLPKLQAPNIVEKESSEDESEQACYMVQGNDSLEVHSETQLDDSANSSGDDHIDADALNEELSIVCENLLEKYKLLKKKSFKLKEKNKDLFSKLNMVCKRW